MSEVQLYPVWKEAVRQVAGRKLEPGTILTEDELYALFQMQKPELYSYQQGQSLKLKFFSAFKKFEEELLVEHHIALKNVVGVGYQVVPPNQQGRWGYSETLREIRQAFKKGKARVLSVNLDALSAEERKTHADYVAKMSVIHGMIARRNIEKATAQLQIA